jgi:single-strand DNA-binding protein
LKNLQLWYRAAREAGTANKYRQKNRGKSMNKVILMGRLTRDPDIRYSQGENAQAVARYTLAVDRRFRRQDSDQNADFIGCVAFGRQAEFAEKYLHQGTKMVIQGRLQNDNYTDKDGRTVYRNQIVIENQEFAESKAVSQQNSASYRAPAPAAAAPASSPAAYSASPAPAPMPAAPDTSADGFMNIPDSIDEELPFN